MEKSKLKVAIVFGGRSTEHQISLLSAQNVFKSLDRNKFEPVLIGIDKKGCWHYYEDAFDLLNAEDAQTISLSTTSHPILLSQNTNDKSIISASNNKSLTNIDILFPVLHGTYGEDGSIQGLAKLANLPCVGCNILGSAIGMDKDIMKHILRSHGIKVAKWITLRAHHADYNYDNITAELGTELFIKPANLGSSVGVSFTKNKNEFNAALESAFSFDPKVIIEEKITGREIECAVLGNEEPKVSLPGEVEPTTDFYSFESKYLDEKGAILHIPAILNKEQTHAVQAVALETYKALDCQGMARVDMFLTKDNEIIINEINTIPGFTNISMYPKLWEISGLAQKDLITKLIDLAIEANKSENKLKLS